MPNTVFESISSDWLDARPVFIIGAGVSLKDYDFARMKKNGRIVAVKGTMFSIPEADVGVGMDIPRLNNWVGKFTTLPFPVWWAVPYPRTIPHIPSNLHFVKRLRATGLTDDLSVLHAGCTSGFAALQFVLAKTNGAPCPIYLVGYDYQSTNGAWHADARPYAHARTQAATNWKRWAKEFNEVAEPLRKSGYRVYNCSTNSLIDAFPHSTEVDRYEKLDLDRV